MLDVKFYDTIDDALLKFAVVISQRIFTIQSVLWRFRKVYYTSEFRFRGVFLVCELWYYYNIMKNIILDRYLYDNCNHKE